MNKRFDISKLINEWRLDFSSFNVMEYVEIEVLVKEKVITMEAVSRSIMAAIV